MKYFLKILAWFFGVLGFGLLLVIIATLIFGMLWDSGSVNSLSGAKKLLKNHGLKEYKVMISECSKLMASNHKIILDRDKIPEKLKELSPQYVRVTTRNCEINLYKVPAKGIGYTVTKTDDGEYELSWHNNFESWDSHIIEF